VHSSVHLNFGAGILSNGQSTVRSTLGLDFRF
jgi:hypothetical protein